MALCVSWSFQAAQWTQGLQILQLIVLVGVVLGIVMAKSRLPARLAHLLAALAGFGWSAWLTSRVVAGLMGGSVAASVFEVEWQLRSWIWALYAREASSGTIVFLLLLGVLMWIMAYFAAWAVFRWQRVWWAVIVCSVPLLINITYSPTNLIVALLAFLILALLLIVRASLASYQLEWQKSRVFYNNDVVGIVLRVGIIVSVLAIAGAWVVPQAVAGNQLQSAWNRVSQPWQRVQDLWNKAFQGLNYQNKPQVILLSRTMHFAGAVSLTDRPVMDIQAASGSYYWRDWIYQDYTGTGWTNTDAGTVDLSANDLRLSLQTPYEMQQIVTATVTMRQNMGIGGTLVAEGQPLLVSIPVKAAIAKPAPDTSTSLTSGSMAFDSSGPLPTGPGGPSLLFPEQPLQAGQSYDVVSGVSTATADELTTAGTDYPLWVTQSYTQLPASVPSRVRALAEQVTAGLTAPYDKALAIEAYLRTFPYNSQISGPRPGQDGVDYFLFTAKQGYCAYYASAMVVMLREVGVPARYVEGFAQGSSANGVYHLLENNGHAWPEVFFPGYGWIGFEPTASQPLNPRTHPAPASTSGEIAPPRTAGPDRSRFPQEFNPEPLPPSSSASQVSLWHRISRYVYIALAVIGGCAAVISLLILLRKRHFAGMSAVERAYDELVSWAARLFGVRPLAHQTPHEYAGAVGELVPLSRGGIGRITDLYVEERFGARGVEGDEAAQALREVRPAIWHAWLERTGDKPKRLWRKVFSSDGDMPHAS